MDYIFHPSAKQELNKAVDYYEDCQKGLGKEFLEEVYSTIQRIIEFPNAWMQFSDNAYRCLTNRFPFGIIYQIVDDKTIRIVAIMHLHKNPDYWKERE